MFVTLYHSESGAEHEFPAAYEDRAREKGWRKTKPRTTTDTRSGPAAGKAAPDADENNAQEA